MSISKSFPTTHGRAQQFVFVLLDALEVIERLAAVDAAVQRLAGGRAELAELLGVQAAALRTAHLRGLAEQAALAGAAGRRGDAVVAQRLAALDADPVGGPGRVQPALQVWR